MTPLIKYPMHYLASEFYVGQIVYLHKTIHHAMRVEIIDRKYDQLFVYSLEGGKKYLFLFKPEMLVSHEDIVSMYKEKLLVVCVN
jgi:hypothetical protein